MKKEILQFSQTLLLGTSFSQVTLFSDQIFYCIFKRYGQ